MSRLRRPRRWLESQTLVTAKAPAPLSALGAKRALRDVIEKCERPLPNLFGDQSRRLCVPVLILEPQIHTASPVQECPPGGYSLHYGPLLGWVLSK